MSSRGCARTDRARIAVAGLLALALAGVMPAARATEPLLLRMAAELGSLDAPYESLIVEVSVNRRSRGDFTVYRDRTGDYYFKAADVAALGLWRPDAGRSVRIEGESFVSLRSLEPTGVSFDEARLVLDIAFPAPRLQNQIYDLAPRRPRGVLEPHEPAAFVNYRLSASDDRSPEPSRLGLANEAVVRIGDAMLRNESALIRTGGSTRVARYATQLVYDRREEQQRLTVGDHTATSGELGSTLAVGGIGFSKLYQMTPYFIRQPLAGFAGTVSTPSQVEVRLGGVPVFREQVEPGPFEVKNLQNFHGARDVEVVVRDALGREQVIGYPYYFADQALRAGLHEYSYSLGALHEEIGTANGHYGAGVMTALHRYGVSDRVTLGLRGELARDLGNVGPTAVYRNDRLGATSAGVSFSRREGRGGAAGSLAHVYQARHFELHGAARGFSEGYAAAQDLLAPSGLRSEYGLGGSVTAPGWGSLFIDRTVTRRWQPAELPASTLTRVGYNYSFGSRASLFATLSRAHTPAPDAQVFVGLLISFDRTTTLNLNARQRDGFGESYGAQLAGAVPTGEGFGYRVGYDGASSGDASQVNAYAQYNGRSASVTLDAVAARNGDTRADRYEAALLGAVTYAGGRLGLTRQIDDSFVAVQLAAPLEGVRVYSNNQEVGRTDREGRLLVPQVGSFYETQITIDERDVPLDHTIGDLRRVVAPAYRSGSLLGFDVRKLRAVEGVLLVRSEEGPRPAANAQVTLLRDGRVEEFSTGRDGRFYIEDLAPGRYEARLQSGARECRFALTVPASNEPILSLPGVTACD